MRNIRGFKVTTALVIFSLGLFVVGNTSYGQSDVGIRTFEDHSEGVAAVVVTPDGRHVVSADRDATAKLWDLETGALIRTFEGHANYVYDVEVTPDGRHVVTGSRDGTAKLWELETGELVRTFEGHTGFVHDILVTPDGRQIATGSMDRTIMFWDLGCRRQRPYDQNLGA